MLFSRETYDITDNVNKGVQYPKTYCAANHIESYI